MLPATLCSLAVILLLYLSHECHCSNTFFRVKSARGGETALLGNHLTLKCAASALFEYCTWSHGYNNSCTFELKYEEGRMKKMRCSTEELTHRIFFKGKLTDNYECGSELRSVREDDLGLWTCSVENFRIGQRRGQRAEASVYVKFGSQQSTSSAQREAVTWSWTYLVSLVGVYWQFTSSLTL